jgi:DNA-binding CsgD family transcriptional regulator
MTEKEKEKIHLMRHNGQSYSKIASALGISKNTIKSYCRRNNLGAKKEKEIYTSCKQCGKALTQGTKGQPKKFCSEECRRLWWKANESQYNKKAFYTLRCIGCGEKFQSYGNKNRKFCSHACYINYRFKKVGSLNDEGAI